MSKLRTTILAAALAAAIAAQADAAAAQEVATASCPGPANSNRAFGPVPGAGNNRFAQTFTVQDTGTLTTVKFGVLNSGNPATSWLAEILATAAGTPVAGALSSATFATPTDPMTGQVTAHPSPAISVSPGQVYALAVSRPGSDTNGVLTRTGDPCPGDLFTGTPAFFPEGSTDEMVLTAYVTPPPPASPTPTAPHRKKCKKKKKRAAATQKRCKKKRR